jgi:hypothetical protein
MQNMYYIGLDVHERTISYCVKDAGGKDCPAFQRHYTSLFCTAESPTRFSWDINTTFENSPIPDGVASTS